MTEKYSIIQCEDLVRNIAIHERRGRGRNNEL